MNPGTANPDGEARAATCRIEAVHPVLMSRDVEASIAFYERPGFRTLFRDRALDPLYAGLRREGAEILDPDGNGLQFYQRSSPSPPEPQGGADG